MVLYQWIQTQWKNNYDAGHSVQQTNDDGYIIGGWTNSFGNGDNDLYLIKTDENGNEIWNQTFGGTNNDQGYSVKQTSDGGYIISGYTETIEGYHDIYLIKTDETGNEEWSKSFGGEYDDTSNSIQQTMDGGYIIIGTTQSFGNGLKDVYIIKVDENGNEEWNQTYGGLGDDEGSFIQQTNDGGFIIIGWTNSFGLTPLTFNDVYLIKTTSNGIEEWSQTFGGIYNDIGCSVQQTQDGETS